MKKVIAGDFIIVNGILGADSTNKKDVVVKVVSVRQDSANLSRNIFSVKAKAWGKYTVPTSVREQYIKRIATKKEISNSNDYGYLN